MRNERGYVFCENCKMDLFQNKETGRHFYVSLKNCSLWFFIKYPYNLKQVEPSPLVLDGSDVDGDLAEVK